MGALRQEKEREERHTRRTQETQLLRREEEAAAAARDLEAKIAQLGEELLRKRQEAARLKAHRASAAEDYSTELSELKQHRRADDVQGDQSL